MEHTFPSSTSMCFFAESCSPSLNPGDQEWGGGCSPGEGLLPWTFSLSTWLDKIIFFHKNDEFLFWNVYCISKEVLNQRLKCKDTSCQSLKYRKQDFSPGPCCCWCHLSGGWWLWHLWTSVDNHVPDTAVRDQYLWVPLIFAILVTNPIHFLWMRKMYVGEED